MNEEMKQEVADYVGSAIESNTKASGFKLDVQIFFI